ISVCPALAAVMIAGSPSAAERESGEAPCANRILTTSADPSRAANATADSVPGVDRVSNHSTGRGASDLTATISTGAPSGVLELAGALRAERDSKSVDEFREAAIATSSHPEYRSFSGNFA